MAKKFPSEVTLRKISKRVNNSPSSSTLPLTASPAQKFKFEICKRLLIYMKDKSLSQREFAKLLGVHESRVSEIIHYKVNRVTMDRLAAYIEIIDKDVCFKVA